MKKKWIEAAAKNEERYENSFQILQTIYNKYVFWVYYSFTVVWCVMFQGAGARRLNPGLIVEIKYIKSKQCS